MSVKKCQMVETGQHLLQLKLKPDNLSASCTIYNTKLAKLTWIIENAKPNTNQGV